MALRGWTRWLPSSLLALHSSSCVGTNGMALCALWRQWPWNMLAASGVAQALGGSMILPDVTTDLNKRKMRTSQRNWCLTASWGSVQWEPEQCGGDRGDLLCPGYTGSACCSHCDQCPDMSLLVCKTTVQAEKGESWSCWAKRQDDAEVKGLQKCRGVWGRRKHKGKFTFPLPKRSLHELGCPQRELRWWQMFCFQDRKEIMIIFSYLKPQLDGQRSYTPLCPSAKPLQGQHIQPPRPPGDNETLRKNLMKKATTDFGNKSENLYFLAGKTLRLLYFISF